MFGLENDAREEHVIRMSSIVARTWVASAVVHASVAAAFVAGAHGGVPVREPERTVEIDTTPPAAIPETPHDEPRAVAPDEPARAPNVVAHPRAPSMHARTEPSPHSAPDREAEAPPAVVAGPASAPPLFVMAFGTAAPETGGRSRMGAAGATDRGDEAETYPESGVSARARLLEGLPPEYPPAARAAAVEAHLPLEIVVNASGSVVDARLLQHAGYGLDEAALRAVRAYRFAPAQHAGHGVSVRMRWVVDFRLD